MLDMIKQHSESVGLFLSGLAAGEKAQREGDQAARNRALERIDAGPSRMLKTSERQKWTWAARFNLADLVDTRMALKRPRTEALTKVGGRPIGYVTGEFTRDSGRASDPMPPERRSSSEG